MKRNPETVATTRRRLLAGGASVLMASVTAGCSDVPSPITGGPDSATDWPMYQYDAANTGYTPDPGPTTEVTIRWSVDSGQITLYWPAAIVQETMYLGGHNTLFALEIGTGEERWRADGFSPTATAVADGIVIGGGEKEGTIYGLDTETGDELWQFVTDNGGIVASPTVADGLVFIGTTDGVFRALDAETGDEQWTYTFDGLIHASAAVVDGTVYIGDWAAIDSPNRLVALDRESGAERWRVESKRAGQTAAPVVVDGMVYVVRQDGTILALAAETGRERWSVTHDGAGRHSPAGAAETLYVPASPMTAYDATTGEERWVNEDVDAYATTPALTDDTVYVTGYHGHVHALDATTGEHRWQFEVADLPQGRHGMGAGGTPPVVSGGIIYVAGGRGNIYALEEA